MKTVKLELEEKQLDIILESIQICLNTFQLMTHHKKYLTEEEALRINIITLTYEEILSSRSSLESVKNKTENKNYKKIS